MTMSVPRPRGVAYLVLVVSGIWLTGCDNMKHQPVERALEAPRPVPVHAVAQSDPARPPAPPRSLALLQRGRERYTIYCAPCHGTFGKGEGIVVQRGYPAPPSYHTERLRDAPDEHFYEVISQGYGVMYDYANRIAPADRWAIVAYVRALQRSQHGTRADVPPEFRAQLGMTEDQP